jgi:hypothetical protein
MDAPGVTTGDSLDQNAQNAPRCVSRSLLRDCELFSHGLLDICTSGLMASTLGLAFAFFDTTNKCLGRVQ